MTTIAQRPFPITSTVIHLASKRLPWPALRGVGQDLIVNDLVDSAVTDEQGAFLIEFDAAYFEELFFDRIPNSF